MTTSWVCCSYLIQNNNSSSSSTILPAERSFKFNNNNNDNEAALSRKSFPICIKLRRHKFAVKSMGSGPDADESNGRTTSSSSSSSFLSFLCQLLKIFNGGDPSGDRNYSLEVATSFLSTLSRLYWGSTSTSTHHILPLPLQLYEFEACPFCRWVREALTELDLLVEVYPCPKGSIRHREMVKISGGKEQFPFLIDPNTNNTSMYESGKW